MRTRTSSLVDLVTTVGKRIGVRPSAVEHLPPFRSEETCTGRTQPPSKRSAAEVDAAIARAYATVNGVVTDAELASIAGVSVAQAKRSRGRLGIPGRRGRPRGDRPRRLQLTEAQLRRAARVPPARWLWSTAEELAWYRIQPHEVTPLRRACAGIERPISLQWLPALGHWGGVSTMRQIAQVVGLPIREVKNYARGNRLKTKTRTHSRTPAILAASLYADRDATPAASAARHGVTRAERHFLCRSLESLLTAHAVTFADLLRWPVQRFERVWASHRFEILPGRDTDFTPRWFKAAPEPSNKVVEALRSGNKIRAALNACNRRLFPQVAARDLETGAVDLDLANDMGLAVEAVDDETGKRRYRASLPAGERKRERATTLTWRMVVEALEAGTAFDSHRLGADDLLALKPPKTDREVHVPNLANRVVHRLVTTHLSEHFHRPQHSFAHQPGKSVILAHATAVKLMKEGYVWAARIDIRRFFPSTDIELVIKALRRELPSLPREMESLVRYLYAANVVRRPSRPEVRKNEQPRWQAASNTLLAGPGSAPILAEVVAAQIFDRPCADVFDGTAFLLRFVDDGLILAKDRETVLQALGLVTTLAAAVGYQLHPEKTSKEPIDLQSTLMQFLGKIYHRGRVTTPLQKVDKLARKMAACELGSRAHRAAAMKIHELLAVDTTERKELILTWVQDVAPEHYAMLDEVKRAWAYQRKQLLHRAHELTLRIDLNAPIGARSTA